MLDSFFQLLPWSRTRVERFQDAPVPAPVPVISPTPTTNESSYNYVGTPSSTYDPNAMAAPPPGGIEYNPFDLGAYNTSTTDLTPTNISTTGTTTPLKSTTGTDTISLADLQNLQTKINDEILRLENLRSTSVTVQSKINKLYELMNAVSTYIGKVSRGELTLAEVPINPADANTFLQNLQADTLPVLMSPSGTTPPSITTPTGADLPATITAATGNTQDIFKQIQHLKWRAEIHVDSDPKFMQQSELLTRLEDLERRVAAYSYSETPMPPELAAAFKAHLKTLSDAILGNTTPDAPNPAVAGPPSMATRAPAPAMAPATTTTSTNGTTTTTMTLQSEAFANTVRKNGGSNVVGFSDDCFFTASNYAPVSPDVYTRPGVVMTDDMIRNRASAAAFNPALVGGADYKKMTQELCRKIEASQLGNPHDLGCLVSPDAVSSSYSWRGAYEMVCNRLGDTWGSWYPEMHGCPPHDPYKRHVGSLMK